MRRAVANSNLTVRFLHQGKVMRFTQCLVDGRHVPALVVHFVSKVQTPDRSPGTRLDTNGAETHNHGQCTCVIHAKKGRCHFTISNLCGTRAHARFDIVIRRHRLCDSDHRQLIARHVEHLTSCLQSHITSRTISNTTYNCGAGSHLTTEFVCVRARTHTHTNTARPLISRNAHGACSRSQFQKFCQAE
jgi:hypothetical protein